MNIDQVIAHIKEIEPATSFIPVKPEWIALADEKYPGMPVDLRRLYNRYGYGSIGDSLYTIHCLLEPKDIYDQVTARNLDGVVIVGDDFAGNCEAYNAANNWQFGSIGDDCKFEPYGSAYLSFTDFLYKWFVNSKSGENT